MAKYKEGFPKEHRRTKSGKTAVYKLDRVVDNVTMLTVGQKIDVMVTAIEAVYTTCSIGHVAEMGTPQVTRALKMLNSMAKYVEEENAKKGR